MMHEKRQRRDRRSDPRYPLAGKIFWRKPARTLNVLGWLSDTSRSGVSFVTKDNDRIVLGEEIELLNASREIQRYCITRIAPYDSRLSLVACRSEPDDENDVDAHDGTTTSGRRVEIRTRRGTTPVPGA